MTHKDTHGSACTCHSCKPSTIGIYDRAGQPWECGQPIFRNGVCVGTCAEPFGTEHDHENARIRAAV